MLLSSSGRVRHKNALKIIHGLRPRYSSDKGPRWLFEPVLRSESHPVFVQPTKSYVMKRYGFFHSRTRNLSSSLTLNKGPETRPDNQVMALTQDSENTLRKLSPGFVASLKASASNGKPSAIRPCRTLPKMFRQPPEQSR